MRELRKISPLSAFRLGLAIYLILGLGFSVLVLVFGSGVVGSVPFAARFGQLGVGILGVVLGTLAYGIFGGVTWGVAALVYNFLARKFGGIKVELI